MVVFAGPRHGPVGRDPGEHRQAGDGRSGAADATTAGHFDRLAGEGTGVQVPQQPAGLVGVAGQQEVGPVDPLVRPRQLVAALEHPTTQVEAVLRERADRAGVAETTAPDPAAVREL